MTQEKYEAAIKAMRFEHLAEDEDGCSLSLMDALRPGYDLEDVLEKLAVAAIDAALTR